MAVMLRLVAVSIMMAIPLVSAGDIIIKPSTLGASEIGLVVIQGAEISTDKYVPLVEKLQNISKYSIWVGIPEFLVNIPDPLAISEVIERILKSMNNSGMPKTAKIFFLAHSLGGIIIQDHLASNPTIAAGQILMGSFLTSKFRSVEYKVPTMTLGGELDGLTRVTRILEEYYFRILLASDQDTALSNFPVIVIKGLSHIQFASGTPPPFVKLRDLKPEISMDDAHAIVSTFISSFLMVHMGDTSIGMMSIVDASHATGVFLAPIIASYKMEGFYTFKPPCNNNPPSSSCNIGSPWSEHAQQIMGGLNETARVNDSDAFHPVYQITPIHLPHVNSNCSSPTSSCVIMTNTVTQNVYEEEELDTGYKPTSANEMRVKLKSRQSILEAAGHKDVDFNTSDGASICKTINQASYDWALKNADQSTVARFQKYGVQMVMGEDEGPFDEGPVWIWTSLSYKNGTDSDGRQICEVRSVMLRTPTDYRIKLSAGMHYCKLLSPARATEWIYVDGLRKYYGI